MGGFCREGGEQAKVGTCARPSLLFPAISGDGGCGQGLDVRTLLGEESHGLDVGGAL